MRPIKCPKTSGTNYHSTLHKIAEEQWFHLHHSGSLKSMTITRRLGSALYTGKARKGHEIWDNEPEQNCMQYDNAVLPVLKEEPGWHTWYSCSLEAEWSGEWIPVGSVIFHANQTSPKPHPATSAMGNQSFTGFKEAGAWCWPTTFYQHRVANGSALYLHLPFALVHKCHAVTFTFTTSEDQMNHFKISPLWTYLLHLRYNGPTAIIFCIMILPTFSQITAITHQTKILLISGWHK